MLHLCNITSFAHISYAFVFAGSQLSLQLQVQFSAPAVTVECPCNISNVAFPASTYTADPLSTQSPASAYMLRASPTLTVPNTNASNFYHYIVYDSTSQFAIELRLNVPGSSASLGVPLLPYFQPSPPGDVLLYCSRLYSAYGVCILPMIVCEC